MFWGRVSGKVNEMNEGFCVWLTGLSGSGKTTLAQGLKDALEERGLKVEVLDGEVVRTSLSQGLGYTRPDRETHLRRIIFVSKLLVRHQAAVVVAAVSPYQGMREEARKEIGAFVEVFLNCPLEVCLERDPKGLYKKARAGEIKNVTGLDDPYEPPQRPEVELMTHEEPTLESLARLLQALETLGRVPRTPEKGYTEEEAELVKKHLIDLGYL